MSYEELADMEHDPEELIGHVKYREGLEEQLIEREQQRADAWAERQMWKDLYLELQAYHEKEEN